MDLIYYNYYNIYIGARRIEEARDMVNLGLCIVPLYGIVSSIFLITFLRPVNIIFMLLFINIMSRSILYIYSDWEIFKQCFYLIYYLCVCYICIVIYFKCCFYQCYSIGGRYLQVIKMFKNLVSEHYD